MTIALTPLRAASRTRLVVLPDPGLHLRATDGGTSMEQSHVSALQLKHAGIERKIHEELSRPMPDLAMVQSLKKQKLKLKEAITHV